GVHTSGRAHHVEDSRSETHHEHHDQHPGSCAQQTIETIPQNCADDHRGDNLRSQPQATTSAGHFVLARGAVCLARKPVPSGFADTLCQRACLCSKRCQRLLFVFGISHHQHHPSQWLSAPRVPPQSRAHHSEQPQRCQAACVPTKCLKVIE